MKDGEIVQKDALHVGDRMLFSGELLEAIRDQGLTHVVEVVKIVDCGGFKELTCKNLGVVWTFAART